MSNFACHPNYDAGEEAAVAAWVKAVHQADYWAATESMQASWYVQYLECLHL